MTTQKTLTTVAVIQSNYLPWKGYFDIIHDADLFIFHDDLQYTKNDWRNRNLIKTPKGREWLTIPVGNNEHRLICQVRIEDDRWSAKHWRLLQQHYRNAPHFARYKDFFEDVYLCRRWDNLSALNQFLIKAIATTFLGIRTAFADSREFELKEHKLERLLELLSKTGASRYVSGPTAKAYIQPDLFDRSQIALVWKDYGDYPEYPQLYSSFIHQVTILDLLFNVGPEAPWYIWGHRERPSARAHDVMEDHGMAVRL